MTRFILQWNCRGLGTSASDLQALIGRRNSIAVCLQETKLAPDSIFSLRGYNIYRKDIRSHTIAHGGVLLGILRDIPSQQVTLNTSLQAVAARVHVNGNTFTLCSLYLPPGLAFPCNEFTRLIAELPPPVVVLGDFNAHHVAWGCNDCCTRGRVLERKMHEESLCVLNNGTRTYCTTPRICELTGVKNRKTITATNMRKYLATIAQVMNLKENEMDMVASHLGHDLAVHRRYYRLQDSTIELSKIARLLMSTESRLGEFDDRESESE